MDFVSQKAAMSIKVQGTSLREAQRDIIHHHEEGQNQDGLLSQKVHIVTSAQGDADPEAHQEGIQWEEDANLSTHHHKGENVTKV